VLHRALAQPNGIVLVTGPTGSGKTTTLYAALGRLNDGARNILTVEDPVEYAVDGVGQTQVNPRLGLTFAAGLRAILRQDPDVVMVGEIRDAETAQIAVQAALTGHLVLATVTPTMPPVRSPACATWGWSRSCWRRPCARCWRSGWCGGCARIVARQKPCLRLAATLGLEPGSDGARARLRGLQPDRACGRVGVFEALWVDDGLRRLLHDDAGEARLAGHAFAMPASGRCGARAGVGRVVGAGEAARILRQDQG
jgi:general secretion pathway protein E